jgi:hypothetical protein
MLLLMFIEDIMWQAEFIKCYIPVETEAVWAIHPIADSLQHSETGNQGTVYLNTAKDQNQGLAIN